MCGGGGGGIRREGGTVHGEGGRGQYMGVTGKSMEGEAHIPNRSPITAPRPRIYLLTKSPFGGALPH